VTTSYEPGARVLEMPGAAPTTRTSPNQDDLAVLGNDINSVRPMVDLLTVTIHWGISGSKEVADYQRTVGHLAIHSGADLVLGTHPHVPQGIEVLSRPGYSAPGIICYSLGNFTFDWPSMNGRVDGLILRCFLDPVTRASVHISYVPVGRNDTGQPGLLSPQTGAGKYIVDEVETLSRPFGGGIRFEPAGNEIVIWSALQH